MPLRPSRLAKAAVVTAAVNPGPSPVAKAAVVGAAVSGPGRPVAKTAVVAAAVTPGRRRFKQLPHGGRFADPRGSHAASSSSRARVAR
jgi:hypothetical protein